jgi:hypothetical protein
MKSILVPLTSGKSVRDLRLEARSPVVTSNRAQCHLLRQHYSVTILQLPSFIGRNASSAGIVARSL